MVVVPSPYAQGFTGDIASALKGEEVAPSAASGRHPLGSARKRANVSRETSGPSDAGRRLADGPALPAAGAALLNPYLADSPIERLRLSDTVGRSFRERLVAGSERPTTRRDGGSAMVR